MKVVGIDLIKKFLNFKFEKSATFFVDLDLDMKNNYVPLKIAFTQNIVVYASSESSRNPVSEVKKKVKNGVRAYYLARRKFKGRPAVY